MAPKRQNGQTNKQNGKQKNNQVQSRRRVGSRPMAGTSVGPTRATSFSTPPAAFGATLTSAGYKVTNIPGGIRVLGEDFLASCSATSTGGTWNIVAAAPLGPSSMNNSAVVDFARIYTQFRVVRAAMCYVPSVATTATGQVALYYRSNRVDPGISPAASSFLPWLLSSKNGIIGPVWQPMAYEIVTGKDWMDTEPFSNADPNHEVDGEVFIASNAGVAGTPSPSIGLVKVQYIMEFRGFARNPKASLIPLPDQVYIQLGLGLLNENVTAGNVAAVRLVNANLAGVTVTTLSNANAGDVYKIILDQGSFSTGTGVNPSSMWRVNYGGGNYNTFTNAGNALTIYGVYVGAAFAIYPTFDGAVSGGSPMTYNYTQNPSSWAMNAIVSMVGSVTQRSQTTIGV